MKTMYILLSLIILNTCQWSTPEPKDHSSAVWNPTEIFQNKAKAYFASGCFWCVEAIYENIIGVDNVISGYSGGFTKNPTYNIVNTETTGHSETIEVIYNPKIISFTQLVEVYFGTQNIEQVNGQGPDKGSQYRSIIFFQNSEEKSIILDKIKESLL